MNYTEKLFGMKGKVVVVTGGSGIIGGQLVDGYLQSGAKVVILDKNEERLNQKVASAKSISKFISGIVCNVLNEPELKAANEKIINKFDRIDVLVNAAGGQIAGTTLGVKQPVFKLGIENFNKVMELNLNGTVLPTFILGETIAKQKSGAIINISSMAAFRSITRVVGYSVAKGGIDNFTKWMAMEMAMKYGDGIRVNAIAPGFFITDQNRAILVDKKGKLTPRSKAIIKMTPFGRFGEPDELIGTVLFLSSDASKFVTGTVIPIDGGFNIFSGV
jgi:NAD(P)-dependent dehydrogenase (short-subunit alcohol dehydrogenase family)